MKARQRQTNLIDLTVDSQGLDEFHSKPCTTMNHAKALNPQRMNWHVPVKYFRAQDLEIGRTVRFRADCPSLTWPMTGSAWPCGGDWWGDWHVGKEVVAVDALLNCRLSVIHTLFSLLHALTRTSGEWVIRQRGFAFWFVLIVCFVRLLS